MGVRDSQTDFLQGLSISFREERGSWEPTPGATEVTHHLLEQTIHCPDPSTGLEIPELHPLCSFSSSFSPLLLFYLPILPSSSPSSSYFPPPLPLLSPSSSFTPLPPPPLLPTLFLLPLLFLPSHLFLLLLPCLPLLSPSFCGQMKAIVVTMGVSSAPL